ncbi:hypothetical protein ABD76_21745 [Paenibacillus dendritiformis]|nr:hypothetical protein [Paenibacillus dendritiformis]
MIVDILEGGSPSGAPSYQRETVRGQARSNPGWRRSDDSGFSFAEENRLDLVEVDGHKPMAQMGAAEMRLTVIINATNI